MPDSKNAPEGWEWKYVKLPREKRLQLGNREVMFITADMHEATMAVLTPVGETGVKCLPRRRGNA